MEEKYQLKEGCLTIQMPKELDHHEAGRLKMEADSGIRVYGQFRDRCDHWKMQEHGVFRRRSGSSQYE